MVATGERTAGGKTIFAKNSDRPAEECQPLLMAAARDHEKGARLACQFIEIEQVEHTYAFLGASPYWLWGLEHGVNECGVAIGNHTIFTRDPVAETGLQGMDLVRLGLERAATATEAMDVIVSLIEKHGQGGSGHVEVVWPYHNSFLIADAEGAWLLEASAGHWAAKKVKGGASATNHTTIGTDWDRLSADCVEHAVAEGWWQSDAAGRFDFAAAYRDSDAVPASISAARYGATCAALAPAGAPLDVAAFKRAMRDHYDSGEVFRPGRPPEDEKFVSVCAHADPVGTTTASMVVELDADRSRPLLCWMAFANPCISLYLPLFVGAGIPAEFEQGGMAATDGGAWWRFKALLTEVEKDFAGRGPVVRDFWREFENGLLEEADGLLAAVGDEPPSAARSARLSTFTEEVWRRASAALDDLLRQLRTG